MYHVSRIKQRASSGRRRTMSRDMRYMMRESRRGQILVEMMVSLTVLTIGLLGAVTLYSQSIRYNRLVADTNIATYLAAEGIEVTKNLIDANILRGFPWNCGIPIGSGNRRVDYGYAPAYAMLGPPWSSPCPGEDFGAPPVICINAAGRYYSGTPSCPSGELSPYRRTVTTVQDGGGERITLLSTVDWTEAQGAPRSVVLQDSFSNWRP